MSQARKRYKPMAVYVNKRTGILPKLEVIGASGIVLLVWGYIGYLALQLPIPF